MKQVTNLFRTWIAAIVAVLAFPAVAQTVYTVGVQNTTSSSTYPLALSSAYSYGQSIYTPAELNIPVGTVITKIAYLPTSTTVATGTALATATQWNNAKDWVVYMGNTTVSNVAGTTVSDWLPVSGMAQVFSGVAPIPLSNTWLELTLSTPFTYTGGNLVIAVDENSVGTQSTSWAAFAGGANFRSIYYSSSSTNFNPSSPISATSRSTVRPLVRLTGSPVCASTSYSGTYTVGGQGANFASMTEAMSALSCGMTGDVTLNVNTGVYSEYVNIGNFANPSNFRLTVQANPANTGTVEFTSDFVLNNYVFQINARNNVTLRNLTFSATGTNSGSLVLFRGQNSGIEITNCQFIGTSNTSTTLNGIAAGSSTYYTSPAGWFVDRFSGLVKNNTFNLPTGQLAVGLASGTGDASRIVGNNITVSTYGVYAQAVGPNPDIRIDSNTVVASSVTSGYGIYAFGSTTTNTTQGQTTPPFWRQALIRNNNVKANTWGLSVLQTFGTSSARSVVANNIVTDFNNQNTSTARGLYFYVVGNLDVHHNSVLLTGGSAGAGRAAFFNGLVGTTAPTGWTYNMQSGVSFANNILANYGPGQVIGFQPQTTSTAYPTATSLYSTMFSTLNNNTYYGLGTSTALFQYGTPITDFAAYKASMPAGFETNSLLANPEYNSTTDLTPQGISVSDNGLALGYTTDFSGAARSATTPDRGAIEFVYYPCKRPAAATISGRGISSLDVSWTSLNSSKLGTAFRYRKQGVTAWTRQVVFGSASTARIAGLSANSTYEIYLYELCSATDSSQLTASAITGTTLCSYSTVLPVSQNFEGTTPISGCWVAFPSTATNGWSVQGPSTTAGPTAASEGTKYSYLNPVSPTASGPYSLEFQGRALPADAKQINFDYWVGNGWNVKPMSGTLESGTTSTNACGPFFTYWQDARFQYIIRASEMHQLYGANAGAINSIAFDVTGLPQFTMRGFTIKIGTASINAFPTSGAVVLTGATNVVYSQGTTPLNLTTTGSVVFPFSSAYSWDGVSDLLIDVCFDNPGSGEAGYIAPGYGNNGIVRYSNMHYNSTIRQSTDGSTGCAFPSTQSRTVLNIRPNMTFGFTPGAAVTPIVDNTAPAFVSPLKLQASTDDGLTWADAFTVPTDLANNKFETWNTAEVSLVPYINTNTRLRFLGPGAGTTATSPKRGVAIDRIITEDFNPCKRPSIASLSNVSLPLTSASARISWERSVSNETSWEVEYGAAGHTAGTGTILATTTNSGYVLSGLTPATTYTVFVRAVCSATEKSAWVGPLTITTRCAPATVSNQAESFENAPWIPAATNSSVSNCWNFATRSTSDATFGWNLRATPHPTTSTGPATAATGLDYLYVETSAGNGGAWAYLDLPEYTFANQAFPKISLNYHMFGAGMGVFMVQASTNGGDTWVNLDTITGQQQTSNTAAWTLLDLSLRAYANAASVNLRLAYQKGLTSSNASGDMAIDDVKVYDGCSVNLDNSTISNASCNGDADGSITLVASSSNGVAEFGSGATGTWGSAVQYDDLVAGTYTFRVRDAFGCTNVQQLTITEPAILASTATSVAADCFGANTASLNATFTGGTAPYTYDWSLANDTVFSESSEDLASIVAGQYTVHLTDANGCEYTQNYTVGQAPQIVGSTVTTSTVSCTSVDGSATIAVTGGTGAKAITWDTPTPQTGLTITGLPPGLYTATITDANNCAVTFEQRINASDSVGSQVVSSTNVTCLGQANGQATITHVGGDAPYQYRWNTNPIQTSATATNLPAGTYVGRVTDNKGCFSVRTVVIGISDAVAPTLVTKSATISLDNSGTATLSAGDVILSAADNCGIVSTSVSKTSFTCADKGANTVNVTVVDGNGNATTVAAQVQVVDLIAPALNTTSSPMVLTLGASGTVAFDASSAVNAVTDNCGTVTVTAPTVTYACGQIGLQSVNITATDPSGNTTTGTVYVLIQDNTAPVITSNAAVSVYLNASGTASVSAAALGTATDNCTSAVGLVTSLSKSTFNCADRGVEPVVMTVTDAAGNAATRTFNVTVMDTIKPTLTSVATLSAPLNAQGVAVVSLSQLNISSADNCGTVAVNTSSLQFGCSNLGANTIQIVAKDGSGNTRTRNVAVTVTDAIAPSLSVTASPVVLALNASGQATLTSAALVNSVSDNCSAAPTVTLSKTAFTCTDKGNNTVTVTATDAAGNVTTKTATVVVMDLTAPVVTPAAATATVTLNASGQGSVTLAQLGSATDNCSGVTLVASKLQFTCAEVGSQVVVLTATDASGNVTTATKTVTVVDNSAPVLGTTPSNVTVGNCASQVNYSYTVTDNCGFTVKRTAGLPSGSTFPLGATVVTHEFKDGAGNTTSHSFTVTVVNAAPTVPTVPNLCPNDAPVSLGSIQGMVITGPGVSNGMFNPALANAGNNVLNYTFTASNGCIYTGVINAFVNAAPAQPTVSLLPGGLLDANTIATTYQWFYNGTAIATGVNKIQPVVGLGRYQVEVTNTLGCSAASAEVNYNGSSLGADELSSLDLRVYPVPATDFVKVVGLSSNNLAGLQVYTLSGQALTVPVVADQSNEIQLNTSSLPSGLYLARLTSTEGETRVVRFEIVK